MKKIPQIIIRSYLRRWPLQLRKSQFNVLSRYSWLKAPLEELRSEFFQKEEAERETDEVTTDQQPDHVVARTVRDSKITEILRSEGLRGQRSTYQVEHDEDEDAGFSRRGNGALFKGVDTVTRQPVIIKFYPLSQVQLNQVESSACEQQFQNLVRLSHPDNQPQEDLRVSWPIDAITPPQTEDYYFLVMDQDTHGLTLKHWLAQQALPLAPAKVRSIIGQILQSLMHLHHHPIRLASGQLQSGLVHGNLNLESVLCVERSGEDFFYLSDLALWEHPLQGFDDIQRKTTVTGVPELETIQQDLGDLGLIGASLLQIYGAESDTALAKFLKQLTDGQFQNTESAWQAWLRLPPLISPASNLLSQPEDAPDKPRKTKWRWRLIAGGTLLGLLAVGGGWWWLRSRSSEVASLPCCLDQVERVPEGEFTYTMVEKGSWHRVIEQSPLFEIEDLSLDSAIRRTHTTFQFKDQPDLSKTIQEAIDKVNNRKVDFAVIPLVNNVDLPPELGYEIIAYDGLAVFVPFSYDSRQGGLPNELEAEQLSVSDIRHIYTAQSDGETIKTERGDARLYMPENSETIDIFKKEVLLEQEPLLEQFDKLWTQSVNDNLDGHVEEKDLQSLPIVTLLRTMLANFERDNSEKDNSKDENIPVDSNEDVLRIGFASLSQVMKQCSVYPLSISDDDNKGIQPLVMKDGMPITPRTNLCDDKNLYQANVDAFRRNQYPLAYPIVVVFPRDNSHPSAGQKFAEMMRTVQAQQLLLEANLVPIVDPFELARTDVIQLAQDGNSETANRSDDEAVINDGLSNFQSQRPTVETPELPGTSGNYVLTPAVPAPAPEKLNLVGESILPAEPTEPESEEEAEEVDSEANVTEPDSTEPDAADE